MNKHSLKSLGLVTLMAFSAACSDDGTSPEVDLEAFDAEAALADYEALDGVVNSSSWEGFQALGTKFSFGSIGSGAPAAVAAVLDGLGHDSRANFTQTLMANLGDLGIYGAPVISPVHRGITFEWDPVTEDYVASERSGAPDNGVRFVLYETDANDDPIPSQEIGHADLIDEGDTSEGIALRLSVTEGTNNFLDYRVQVVGELGTGEVMIDGFVQDDRNRLDFDIDVEGSRRFGSETVDISFDAQIADRDFQITANVEGVNDATGESGAILITARHGNESLRLDFSGTDTSVDGTIDLNGSLFATVSGDPDNPTFTGASGDGLTAQEILVLHEVVKVAEDIFELFEDLMEPAAHIILLGIVL